ncbi:hypothetical protein ABL78_2788 [Leptomonas seymouri]|uniref:BRCT domain-containing protein n=1 Tax=Leptomonas seymouri TaxID=5684 RepID=A0A0N1I8R5_LEPSE|nr:hypothetical protein ABL78_2788 [Leptomonas seymouri]|eukprot:KPI88101.1 hypothetical protein ABL78_2788 [Leptomonas seymouri]
MSSDAQALLRQLTENPDVLEGMQHMLSLLRANPPKSAQHTATGAITAKANAPRARPPRTGYDDSALSDTNKRFCYNGTADASYRSNDNHNNRSDDEEHGGDGGASSPLPTLAESEQCGGRTACNAGRPQQRSLQQQVPTRSATAAADLEEIHAASKKLIDAQRRIAELERELQRTTQRMDQLSEVVHKQKKELQEAQDRHTLELEETRHAYDAVVRRKDEVQEEALRQLTKSRQLMLSAARFEAVVAAKRKEKENCGTTSSPTQAPAAGLTASVMAVNTRHSSHLLGSGMKRERQDDAPEARSTAKQDFYDPYSEQQQQQQTSKRTASDSWGTTAALGRARQEGSRNTNNQPYSSNKTPGSKTESPEFITSPTPVTKSSSALVSGGGTRTQSRSARRRRTPRTPSLTNADRVASVYKYIGKNPAHTANSGSAPSHRQLLPGTNSLKLDSPTPVVSTTWTAGRSLTSSQTPPPPPAPVCYAAAAASAKRQQHAQLAKPPLTQRAAGRLAAQPLVTPRTVPNTRSGTSSVAADGPTRSPSPVNPKRGNAGPRRFVFTGLKDGEPQQLVAAVTEVGDDAAVLASELDEVPPTSTTHIVLRGTPRSVKALCGVVSSKWLVSPEYILNSLDSGFWLDEVEEGGMRIFPPPLQGQRFLLTVEHSGIRAKLAQVIEYGGGEVLPVNSGKVAQDVVVITSGDDLLRYATEGHM